MSKNKRIKVTDPEVRAYYERRGYALEWESCAYCGKRVPAGTVSQAKREEGLGSEDFCLCPIDR